MAEAFLDSNNIVHLAAGLYLAGFLFRDQIMLRALVIAGDVVYILYYYFAPAVPLWEGIYWSLIFMVVNAVMIVRIVADRAHFSISDDEMRLFRLLDTMTPGEFRRMMRVGRWYTAEKETELTLENAHVDRLFYILEGTIMVEKGGNPKFTIEPGVFIGEVAFLLTRTASATVTVAPGARYVAWDAAALRRLLIRAPSLRIAFNAALNRDMAAKVARA